MRNLQAACRKFESAAEGRRIATLALEARNKGKLTTTQVIARYEEVTRLDPGVDEKGKGYECPGWSDDALVPECKSLPPSQDIHPTFCAVGGKHQGVAAN